MAKFITLEGGEGAGKSVQLKMLAEYLRQKKIDFLTTREPGGSVGAEEIRQVILNGNKDKWDAIAETLLFSAGRRDHLERLIKPALKSGKWVICDRFADSTLAYQGYGREDKLLSLDEIEGLYRFVAGDFKPDLTLILDIPPQIGLARALERGNNNRMEEMDLSFHKNIRQGFLEIAKNNPFRCVVIDATQSEQEVHNAIVKVIEERFL